YIEEMVNLLDLEKTVDKGIIIQLLKNREELMSTAIGNGISLPHPRIPLMVGKNKPLIHFFFPKNSLALQSLDGKPVHTIILLISQTIKQHLSLLSHLSFLLSKETFRFALENRLIYKEILDIISHIESTRSE
ncbi:MAG: PTS sugar transporter subunit IIA, partial [Bacteroidetes bacterium]